MGRKKHDPSELSLITATNYSTLDVYFHSALNRSLLKHRHHYCLVLALPDLDFFFLRLSFQASTGVCVQNATRSSTEVNHNPYGSRKLVVSFL